MKREEILKKAIEKAVENGWNMFGSINNELTNNWKGQFLSEICKKYEIMLFDHQFAKAFWGEKWEHISNIKIPRWRHHLKYLALAEDRLEYISRFLK